MSTNSLLSEETPLLHSNTEVGPLVSSYEVLSATWDDADNEDAAAADDGVMAATRCLPEDGASQAPSSRRLGYEQRRRRNQSGAHVQPQGTILALQNPVLNLEDPPDADPTTRTLRVCRETVLKPYTCFLFLVGWVPGFENASNCCQTAFNILHPLVVLVVIGIGYFIQYSVCFVLPHNPANTTIGHLTGNTTACKEYSVSKSIFLNALHIIAYGYSFYAVRFANHEQLPTLMERVFLQTARTEMGLRSQKRLITTLRALLWGGMLWVVLCRLGEIIHVFRFYPDARFPWMDPVGERWRMILLVWMVVSFLLVDVTYMAVIIHFSVQCLLLIRYINTICEKILERSLGLDAAIKEVSELYSHLRVLNLRSGLALSLILLHFCNFAYSGTMALTKYSEHKYVPLTIFTSILTTALWWLAIILPISIATYLSSRCRHLRMLGHVIRQRPFGFEDVPLAELDSFVLYMSNLNLSSKIFLLPVRIEYIFLACIILTLVLLFEKS